MKKEKQSVAADLQLLSEQGFQRTSTSYFKLTQCQGKPYGTAMAENYFAILKTESIYQHKPKPFQEANDLIDTYIHIYNYERKHKT